MEKWLGKSRPTDRTEGKTERVTERGEERKAERRHDDQRKCYQQESTPAHRLITLPEASHSTPNHRLTQGSPKTRVKATSIHRQYVCMYAVRHVMSTIQPIGWPLPVLSIGIVIQVGKSINCTTLWLSMNTRKFELLIPSLADAARTQCSEPRKKRSSNAWHNAISLRHRIEGISSAVLMFVFGAHEDVQPDETLSTMVATGVLTKREQLIKW